MIDFIFQNPTKIIFGREALGHLAQEVRLCGTRVLMVYGGGSIKRTGVYDRVMEQLKQAKAQVWELSGIQPNPLLGPVRKGIAMCRENDIQLVLAVGGGSAIDTAKAIANGACYEGDVWDLFMKKGANDHVLPLGVVLTIPASGSEMSSSCVITREEDRCKAGRNTPFNFPKFSILNPEFAFTLPPFQRACGVVDIMAHMMERYFTQVEPCELTDRLIEGAMLTVMRNAPIVMENPTDYDAWAEITWTGTLAHNTLLQTGRIDDWASHKIEHELSALYDIAHGAGLAIIFPAWMKYVLPRGGEKKLCQFATKVMGVPEDYGTPEAIAKEGIARLEAFYRSLGLTTTLHENGIGEENFPHMSQHVAWLMGGTVGQFVKLTSEDVMEIYRLAL